MLMLKLFYSIAVKLLSNKKLYPVLQSITAILKEYPSSKFSIEGHTDSDGKDAANQKLSEDRAGAVKNYLIENGIDASDCHQQVLEKANQLIVTKLQKVKLTTEELK
jgi:OOP family OmpA-OmpF porin